MGIIIGGHLIPVDRPKETSNPTGDEKSMTKKISNKKFALSKKFIKQDGENNSWIVEKMPIFFMKIQKGKSSADLMKPH